MPKPSPPPSPPRPKWDLSKSPHPRSDAEPAQTRSAPRSPGRMSVGSASTISEVSGLGTDDASAAATRGTSHPPSPPRSPHRPGSAPRSPGGRSPGRRTSAGSDDGTPFSAHLASLDGVQRRGGVPASRRQLQQASPQELHDSPMVPLDFDMTRLRYTAGPTRQKDTAIVALSRQLEAMRERLSSAETAAQESAEKRSRQVQIMDERPIEVAPMATLPQPTVGRPSAGTAFGEQFERNRHLAILRLEDECRAWKVRVETVEKREAAARAHVEQEVHRARNEVLLETAMQQRRLHAMQMRSLARAFVQFEERHLRRGLAAFKRNHADVAATRQLIRVAMPQWRSFRTAAAWRGFKEALAWRRRLETAAFRVRYSFYRRLTIKAFNAWHSFAERSAVVNRKTDRKALAIAGTRGVMIKRAALTEWRDATGGVHVLRRKIVRLRLKHVARFQALVFLQWAHAGAISRSFREEAESKEAHALRLRIERHTRGFDIRRAAKLLREWHGTVRKSVVVKVSIARAQAVWTRSRMTLFFGSWATYTAATRKSRYAGVQSLVDHWRREASTAARHRRLLERHSSSSTVSKKVTATAFHRWARDAAISRASAATARADAAAAAMAAKDAEIEALKRAADVERRGAAEATARELDTQKKLAAAETRAPPLALTSDGLLDCPLGWRPLQCDGDSSFASNADPAAPIFLPKYGAAGAEDGDTPERGCAVMIMAGGSRKGKMSVAVLDVDTVVDPESGILEAKTAWLALDSVSGTPPEYRENPAVCAVPPIAAATAAASAGSDPNTVTGGVFVFGGYDGTKETSDAHVLLRRQVHTRGGKGDVSWEWIKLVKASKSPSPPPRSHSIAFATPPPFASSPASQDAPRADVYVFGGYRSGATQGGLRNDLWRLDLATMHWSNPEQFGDVPAPRRDAAVAVSFVSGSGTGRAFIHGGCAADGEPLADAYSFDIATNEWSRLPPDEMDFDVVDRQVVGGDDEAEIAAFGVAAEIANLNRSGGLSPATRFPSARSHHALAVVGGSLIVHGGRVANPGNGRRDRQPDHSAHALNLETLTWRCLRTGGSTNAPPPAGRSSNHAIFAHRTGILFVGSGSTNAAVRDGAAPPVYALEIAAAREGRRLRAELIAMTRSKATAEDAAARATASAASAADEVRLVRAAAAKLKEEADAIAAAEAEGRDAQRVLRRKLADARAEARDAENAADVADAEAAEARDAALVARSAADSAKRVAMEAREAMRSTNSRADAAEAATRRANHDLNQARGELSSAESDASTSAGMIESKRISELRDELARITMEATSAIEAKRMAEATAEAARERIRVAVNREADAARRAALLESRQERMAEESREAQAALMKHIADLEDEVAKATSARWAKELESALEPMVPALAPPRVDDQETSSSSDDSSSSDEYSQDFNDSDPDLPARIVSMLDVSRPAWSSQ